MTQMTLHDAVDQALAEEMRRDPRVLMFGEGIATKRKDLLKAFGAARVRNTPLAEGIIAGTAAGAAATGLRPVVDLLFAPFLCFAMDELVNSAGKLRYMSGGQFSFPMVALAMTGGGWGVGAQHNHNLEAWFVHAPGLKVVMPSTPADSKGLMKAAIRDENPVLFFMDIGLAFAPGEVPEGEALVPLGQAAVRREGSDVTLISYAKTVHTCLAAAEALAEQGVSAEVIDLRSLKPLDEATILASVRKTGPRRRRPRGQPPLRRRRRGGGPDLRAGLRRPAGPRRPPHGPGRPRPRQLPPGAGLRPPGGRHRRGRGRARRPDPGGGADLVRGISFGPPGRNSTGVWLRRSCSALRDTPTVGFLAILRISRRLIRAGFELRLASPAAGLAPALSRKRLQHQGFRAVLRISRRLIRAGFELRLASPAAGLALALSRKRLQHQDFRAVLRISRRRIRAGFELRLASPAAGLAPALSRKRLQHQDFRAVLRISRRLIRAGFELRLASPAAGLALAPHLVAPPQSHSRVRISPILFRQRKGGPCGPPFLGRSGEIRTLDPLLPKQVRYQAAPRSDGSSLLTFRRWRRCGG